MLKYWIKYATMWKIIGKVQFCTYKSNHWRRENDTHVTIIKGFLANWDNKA